MNWPAPRTGSSLASASSVVPGRLPSSAAMVTSRSAVSPVALSVTDMVTVIGMISSSKIPAACAAAVRAWDSTA